MSSKMMYARPIPVNRAVNSISDSKCERVPLSVIYRALDLSVMVAWQTDTEHVTSTLFHRGAIQHADVRTKAVRCRLSHSRLRRE